MSNSLNFGYIGLGQCGGNIANTFAKSRNTCVAINSSSTDLKKLTNIPEVNQLCINIDGLQGAGKNPEIGRQCLEYNIESVIKLVRTVFPKNKYHRMFICVGLGGGTGGGMADLLSQILIEEGYKVSTICTLPFKSESTKTKLVALSSFDALSKVQDGGACFVIDNAKASTVLNNVGLNDRYSCINEYMSDKLEYIKSLTTCPSKIAFDMRDFESLLSSRGCATIVTINIDKVEEICSSEILSQYITKALDSSSIFAKSNLDIVKGCAFLFEIPKGKSNFLTEETLEAINKTVGNPFEVFTGVFEKENIQKVKLTILLTGLSYPLEQLNNLQEDIQERSKSVQKVFEVTQTQTFNNNTQDFLNKFIKSTTPNNTKKSTESTLSKLLKKKNDK